MSQEKVQWGSRWGFIMAALGMAVGTGNVWRFPREVAQNGGGPFIIAWTIAMLVFAVPVLMAELVIGRKTRLGTIGAFRDFLGKKYTWMGTWTALICFLIMSFYSVVMGWCVKYFALAATGTFKAGMTTDQTQAIWDHFIASPSQTIFFHAVSMILVGFIIFKGVNDGIEKASKIMIPALFMLLLFSAIRAMFMPGAAAGLEYLFSPKWSYLAGKDIWMEAFAQAAWSTGAGWGLILTYAVYTNEKEDVAGNAMIMGLGDNIGALLAGLAVVPALFALAPNAEYAAEVAQAGGTGMTFVVLAQLFGELPGGNIMAAGFFLAMSLAALSSLLPMVEVSVLNLIDMGMERRKATIGVMSIGFLVGIPAAYSMTWFNNQNDGTGFALLFSCLFFVFAVVKYGVEKIRAEEINTPWTDFVVGKWFNVFIYLAPLSVFLVFYQFMPGLWNADNRWQIWGTSWSFGTFVVQWGIYLALCLLTNRFFAEKVRAGEFKNTTESIGAGGENVYKEAQ